MHLLELFSGTNSIGRVFERHGWTVCSIDVVDSFNPTICADIRDVTDEDILYHGYPDAIWASPPCTEYSRAPYDRQDAEKLRACRLSREQGARDRVVVSRNAFFHGESA